MEWVELPEKGTNTKTLEQTVLDTSKVLLFIKSADLRDREKVGLLLETNVGLTTIWAMVKRVCNCFNKGHEWNGKGISLTGPTARGVRCRLGRMRRDGGSSWA